MNRDKVHLYSRASKASYARTRNEKQKIMDSEGLSDWVLDDQLSNKEHSVFTHKNGRDVIFATRGTDFQNKNKGRAGDLFTDALLTVGLEKITPRYKRAERHLKRTLEKHKGKNTVLTGHSLGGEISNELAKKYDLESHVFNKGTSPSVHNMKAKTLQALFNSEQVKKQKKKNHSYVVPGDLISNSAIMDNTISNHVVEKNPELKGSGILHPHNIDHFSNARVM